MRFASLFAGMGGGDLGLERAGMECVAQVEIDPSARRVLAKHWPDVPRFEDVSTTKGEQLGAIDLLIGGFPCQDLSVAGRRAGLAGERSGLFFEFARLIAEVAPKWVLIENVPGLLSSCGCSTCGAMRRILRVHTYLRQKRKVTRRCAVCVAGAELIRSHRGRDFAILLRRLAELGYGVAWRILDAQYLGVPQRRRRVFIVGCAGDAACAASVLFEPESVSGDSPPSREARQDVAGGPARSLRARSNDSHREDSSTYDVGAAIQELYSKTLTSPTGERQDSETETFVLTIGRGSDPLWTEDVAQPITGRNGDPGAVAAPLRSNYRNNSNPMSEAAMHVMAVQEAQTGVREYDSAGTLRADAPGHQPTGTLLRTGMAVRRLTPLECLRLQGFPDDWLDELGLSDSHKYRLCGNAMAVPVVRWIGERIATAARAPMAAPGAQG